MTTTPDRTDLPARRRRHARLIAALNTLIGACVEAAGAVYGPIAGAPPEQEAVEVSRLPCIQVSLAAATLLEIASGEDDARWPASVAREREEARRTFAARCVVAQAQEHIEQDEPPGEHGVQLAFAEQFAVMELVNAGDEVAASWRRDPAEAVALVRELVAGGELTVEEILDQAVDSTVAAGLLALQEAAATSDPSTAAELCLSAIPYIVLAVTLASADLD
ncbi:hypothetical protein ACPC54_30375 [Kitasatospora sp. NPDC094028]